MCSPIQCSGSRELSPLLGTIRGTFQEDSCPPQAGRLRYRHQEEGRRVLDAVLAGLAGVGKVERSPAMDGKRMTALLMPIKTMAKRRVNTVATPAIESKPII